MCFARGLQGVRIMVSGRISETGSVVEAGARLGTGAPKATARLSAFVAGKAVGSSAAEVSAGTAARIRGARPEILPLPASARRLTRYD
jgi:hypothetical protein